LRALHFAVTKANGSAKVTRANKSSYDDNVKFEQPISELIFF